jgi:L-arabinokinase
VSLVFYISGHGFGHASRSIEIINALIARQPDLEVIIRSSVPRWLVERAAHPRVSLSAVEVDTGVVQIDSLHLDAAASIVQAEAFMATFDDRVQRELAFLREHNARLTMSDLPPLGIAAGVAAGVPALASGNFTWAWIYEHYGGGARVAEQIAEVYQQTTLTLRLPMWGGFAAMRAIHDLPFVARRSRRDPVDVRRALGIPLDTRVVLASFGGYGLEGLDAGALERLRDYHVLLPGMIDERAMHERGYRYEDLVHAVDVVASKPGYGIISECIANDAALLYTSRGDFREYRVMVEAMPQYLRCAFIDHPDLFAGNWGPSLDALLAQARPPKPAVNGAERAADMLLPFL